jgi:nicotinamide-nucleotide amidase
VKSLNTAIIATGSELLSGYVMDSNSKFIAENLRELGFTVRGIYLSDDNKDDIIRMINTASENADIIIITGGLGPTEDDLSRNALAEALNKKLIYSKDIEKKLKKFFADRSYEMTDNNLRQAYVPEGAETINNDNGTAPALKISQNGKLYYLLPGVPREMKAIFNKYIQPDLIDLSDKKIIYREYNFIGIGESSLENRIKGLNFDERLDISYQAAKGQVKMRLKSTTERAAESRLEKILLEADKIVEENLEEFLISRDNREILDVFYDEIIKSGLSISTAESFTGGLIAERLTQKEGSSAFFKGSIVAYNNLIKTEVLNIDKKIIEKHGAVSRECVEAMAVNTARIFKSDIAAAASGVAGPGSIENKKAGTMHLAIKFKDEIKHLKLNKNYGRDLNRFYASQIALFEIIKLLKDN